MSFSVSLASRVPSSCLDNVTGQDLKRYFFMRVKTVNCLHHKDILKLGNPPVFLL